MQDIRQQTLCAFMHYQGVFHSHIYHPLKHLPLVDKLRTFDTLLRLLGPSSMQKLMTANRFAMKGLVIRSIRNAYSRDLNLRLRTVSIMVLILTQSAATDYHHHLRRLEDIHQRAQPSAMQGAWGG